MSLASAYNGERGKSTSGPRGRAQDATGIHTKHARGRDAQRGLFPEGFNYKKRARMGFEGEKRERKGARTYVDVPFNVPDQN